MSSQGTGNTEATVARNIRAARDAAGLRQRDLAEQLNLDPMLVSKWERGKHKPSSANFPRLAMALGRDIAWFYTDHDRKAA